MSGSTVQIKINNIPAVRRAMGGSDLMDIAMGGGRIIQSNARTYVPVDTGNLRVSILVEPTEQKNTFAQVQIGTDVEYANIQEFGGTIKPKKKKMLSWIGDDGKRIFARAVQIHAQPYMRPAVDNHKGEIINAIGAMIAAKLRRVTG